LENVVVRVKRLKSSGDEPLPVYASKGSSGMDIRAMVERTLTLQPGDIRLIPTGLAVAIPEGFEGQIRPRSGLALHHGIGMVNSPGTIDADYRGEIGIVMINWGKKPFTLRRGDRIAQMVICRVARAEIEEVHDLDDTHRGPGGFGHTGLR